MSENTRCQIHAGDALTVLTTLRTESVHCCVTSPPYWGLRDYGVDSQLGLESTPELYIANMVEVFREVKRVLRKDGTLWLNMGDSYAAGGQNSGSDPEDLTEKQRSNAGCRYERRIAPIGLKPKDLVGIPWMLAFALRTDGWYLRSDIIWSKPNPMPESVTDRPTKSHEYLFLLSKSEKYFYDSFGIKEPCVSSKSDIKKMTEGKQRIGGKALTSKDKLHAANAASNLGNKRAVGSPSGRNRRTVWTIATQPYKEAHFATFPESLVRPCIQAGTSEAGCCANCGAPFARKVKSGSGLGESYTPEERGRPAGSPNAGQPKGGQRDWDNHVAAQSRGFTPTCNCFHAIDNIESCVVLDPFAGAGTALLVALKMGRRAIGIELNPSYVDMIRKRLGGLALQEALAL